MPSRNRKPPTALTITNTKLYAQNRLTVLPTICGTNIGYFQKGIFLGGFVMAARVHEIEPSESFASADSIFLTHGAVSLGEESSTFGRMAVPSSW
jgi:hypothetical protein